MATATIPGREMFRPGESFTISEVMMYGRLSQDKKSATCAINCPKYIPEDISISIDNATLYGVSNGNGQWVTPTGSLTWQIARVGDFVLQISVTGTSAAGNAVAAQNIVANIGATISFAAG